MCPACVAGVAWIVGIVVTGGGAGILTTRTLRSKRIPKLNGPNCNGAERRSEHGKRNEQTGSAQSGDAR